MGSGKSEVGSRKWEVGSGKWEVPPRLLYEIIPFIFNLENNIFQVVGVEGGFTPSLLHFPLDIWKSGGASI